MRRILRKAQKINTLMFWSHCLKIRGSAYKSVKTAGNYVTRWNRSKNEAILKSQPVLQVLWALARPDAHHVAQPPAIPDGLGGLKCRRRGPMPVECPLFGS